MTHRIDTHTSTVKRSYTNFRPVGLTQPSLFTVCLLIVKNTPKLSIPLCIPYPHSISSPFWSAVTPTHRPCHFLIAHTVNNFWYEYSTKKVHPLGSPDDRVCHDTAVWCVYRGFNYRLQCQRNVVRTGCNQDIASIWWEFVQKRPETLHFLFQHNCSIGYTISDDLVCAILYLGP